MMLLTISYLFLLSFDSHLNVPLNNEDEWNLYLLCYRLCKIGQEWWQKLIPWNCSNHFTVVQPRNDSHSFLKGGKGNRDGFQALSQKCSTDPSPASWQCLFLFLLSVYLTDNILFFPYFFFSSEVNLKVPTERRMFLLSSNWNISEELSGITWFSSVHPQLANMLLHGTYDLSLCWFRSWACSSDNAVVSSCCSLCQCQYVSVGI